MGRSTLTKNKNDKNKNINPKKPCIKCKKEQSIINFYLSKSPMFDGRTPLCKSCIKKLIDYDNMETIYSLLQQMDVAFINDYWQSAVASPTDTFGKYISMAGTMPYFEGFTWKDSVFDKGNNTSINTQQTSISSDAKTFPTNESYDLNYLKRKYGFGYPDDEYYLFEDKYQQLKTSFQLLTTMHEEYFREFCVNKVKETLAKAKGNFKEAKEWAAMVKDVAEAGKLKPSQMSKADLSGGLDTFGQLARMVEENYEIMPLLPQFIEQPKDKVDVTLWCFINYVRDLKGLPECEYKEIYSFYEKKKQDYESQISDSSYVNEEDDDNA